METLNEIIKKLNKKIPNSIITNGKKEKIKSTSTGSYLLDAAIGISGYPEGKVIEIAGGEAAGKTTLSFAAIKSFQNKHKTRKCVFVDMEHTFDNELAKNQGIDVKKLIIINATTGEEAFDSINDMIKTGEVSLIIIDSISAMVSLAEMEDSVGDAKIGMLGRLLSKALKKTIPLADKHKTTIILLNQLREKIGGYKSMYGETRESTGGNALKFYSSLRIQVSKGKPYINNEDKIIGHKMKFKIIKNKVGLPNEKGEIPLLYTVGISKIDEMIEIAMRLGIVKIAGSWYSYVVSETEEQKIGQGIDSVRKYFTETADAYDILLSACRDELARLKKERFNINNKSYKEK